MLVLNNCSTNLNHLSCSFYRIIKVLLEILRFVKDTFGIFQNPKEESPQAVFLSCCSEFHFFFRPAILFFARKVLVKRVAFFVEKLNTPYICRVLQVRIPTEFEKSVMIISNQWICWCNQHIDSKVKFVVQIQEERIGNICLSLKRSFLFSTSSTKAVFLIQLLSLHFIKKKYSLWFMGTNSHFDSILNCFFLQTFLRPFWVNFFEKSLVFVFSKTLGTICISLYISPFTFFWKKKNPQVITSYYWRIHLFWSKFLVQGSDFWFGLHIENENWFYDNAEKC